MQFEDTFYIRPTRGGSRCMLLITWSHYCICGPATFEQCLDKVTEYVKRYKTDAKLEEVLSNLEDCGRVGKTCFDEREAWYIEGGWKKYDPYIKRAVQDGLEYLKEQAPTKKVKRLLKKAPVKTIEVEHKEVKTPSKGVVPKIMKRPVLTKRVLE